ncbi:MAG: lysophospholipid acyltransferase family protein [Anaerolineales bacterium]
MNLKTVRSILRFVLPRIATIELIGLDSLPESQYIIASNHLGRLDSALLYYVFDREDIILPTAEKYKDHPIYGWIGRSMNAIWLNRFDADIHAMKEILRRLKAGGLLAIAPEGTRSKVEALQEAKPGAAYLASKVGLPIIPVALTGTEDRVVKDNLKHLRKSHIKVRAGKPFDLEPVGKQDKEESLHRATDEIMCQIAAMLPEKYRGFYADHPRLKEILG